MAKAVKGAIDKPEQSKEGHIFLGSKSTSDSEKNGNFESCHVQLTIVTRSVFPSLVVIQVKRNFLFEKMKKSDVHLFKSHQVLTLNEDKYS